ncbi:hypothetical protein ES708_05621 [subsurface metagenome]
MPDINIKIEEPEAIIIKIGEPEPINIQIIEAEPINVVIFEATPTLIANVFEPPEGEHRITKLSISEDRKVKIKFKND